MHSAGCDKQSLVVNLGGGVIGDMGGFAASTYMRGVDYLNIPTTLLAQVDASIGGKTGIDFAGIKNLIGTFHQPVAVVIDTQTLATLPKREFLSGFAEIIKHGLIRDKKYYQEVTKKHPLKLSQDELVDIIARSCKIKAEIVESDPRESAYRKLLNFGHTIGHAIESLSLESCAPFLHGEAVSIGMLVEAKISQLDGMLSLPELQRIHQGLIKTDLPVYLTNIEIAKILKKVQSDKKNEKGKVNFTLLQKIGKAVYNQNVSENVIIEAINTYKIK
jgi:3-dehydroquinate synthase